MPYIILQTCEQSNSANLQRIACEVFWKQFREFLEESRANFPYVLKGDRKSTSASQNKKHTRKSHSSVVSTTYTSTWSTFENKIFSTCFTFYIGTC